MQKAKPYILFIGLFAYVIIVLTFVSAERDEVKCKGMRVTIADVVTNAFADEGDVMRVVKTYYGDVIGRGITEIDKDSIERLLAGRSVVKSAQVYYSLDGYLHIEIRQRKPVFRVLSEEGYYVDEDGKIMSLSRKYTSRVVVATGNVSRKFACEELYPFVMALKDDEFWDAYVEQIVVDARKEVTLIPKVGNFRIVLGGMKGYERKMEKLRLFLKKGIARKGWNLYKEINLKFDRQIVCVNK
ncbi:MAG: cell division protein FtsQ [Odoribacter sp.]|nr:cell division protein FtsQ [Odoribacter sp.]